MKKRVVCAIAVIIFLGAVTAFSPAAAESRAVSAEEVSRRLRYVTIEANSLTWDGASRQLTATGRVSIRRNDGSIVVEGRQAVITLDKGRLDEGENRVVEVELAGRGKVTVRDHIIEGTDLRIRFSR
jgi:lipopolysaccharide export system protein LptA